MEWDLRKLVVGIASLAVIAGVAGWFASAPRPIVASGSDALEQGGDAARGQVIFAAGGCASCHTTPGQQDRLKLGGGLELKSPFGSFFAPNISPHPTDGIGRWKVADLVNAMQAGVSPAGEHYFPAFPYTTYAHAKVDDIRDLMAYLRTLEPVAGKAPAHTVGFPFNVRRGLGLWKLAFMDSTPITPDTSQSAEWNRGHYLADALGHCAECHSGRNLLGGIEAKYRYAGGPDLEGKGWVPNITQDKGGIASYSLVDIKELLKSGLMENGDYVGGSMTEVVRNMAALPDSDRSAIATFIKSLPARQSPPKPAR
jgi:mono/diheme cytochrome c family protein